MLNLVIASEDNSKHLKLRFLGDGACASAFKISKTNDVAVLFNTSHYKLSDMMKKFFNFAFTQYNFRYFSNYTPIGNYVVEKRNNRLCTKYDVRCVYITEYIRTNVDITSLKCIDYVIYNKLVNVVRKSNGYIEDIIKQYLDLYDDYLSKDLINLSKCLKKFSELYPEYLEYSNYRFEYDGPCYDDSYTGKNVGVNLNGDLKFFDIIY
jgi:hypothetical protein